MKKYYFLLYNMVDYVESAINNYLNNIKFFLVGKNILHRTILIICNRQYAIIYYIG